MERTCFNEKEIEELKKNKYVKSVSEKTISYTYEFKEHFIEESNNGKGPTRIFIESGFNPYILGRKRIDTFSNRYKNKKKNNESFEDNRGKKATGRPKKKQDIYKSKDEELETLRHENLMLKAENDLLKKMEFLIKQKK